MTWFQAPAVTLPHLVALHGKWRGARIALVEGERRLTWASFERETARAANGLGVLGLKSGDRVAVLMDNSLEMVVLLFGILRFGAVAVPLNVSIADDAVARMIEDAGARALFASRRHCRRIDELRARSEAVDRAVRVALDHTGPGWMNFTEWLSAQPHEWLGAVTPEQECNIIYSSGTTGSPKGIAHTHGTRIHWAVDLEHIAHRVREYLRIMAHWRRVLPVDRFIEVDYEQLVRNPEPAVRRLIAACGLPWDEACLRPEHNSRIIKTPSKWQARQPIHRDAIESWRRYEPWLGPLAALVP